MITIEEILNKRTPLNDKVFLHYDLMNKKAILFIKDHGWDNPKFDTRENDAG